MLQRTKVIRTKIDTFNKLVSDCEDAVTLAELGLEEKDESVFEEVKNHFEEVKKRYEKIRLETLMKGEYDANNAIITLMRSWWNRSHGLGSDSF